MARAVVAVALALGLAACSATEDRAGTRGGTIGYTVAAPDGWQDITRQVEGRTGAGLDVAYGGPVDGGVRANLNIARRDAPAERDLAKVVRDGQAEVEELSGGELEFTQARAAEIDGAPAQRYDFTRNGARVRQVAALHEGDFYVVTLTAPEPAFRRALPRLDGLLRTWRWD